MDALSDSTEQLELLLPHRVAHTTKSLVLDSTARNYAGVDVARFMPWPVFHGMLAASWLLIDFVVGIVNSTCRLVN